MRPIHTQIRNISALNCNLVLLMEEGVSGEKKADELLRTGRLVFLQAVGYTPAQITSYGDLAALPSETMRSLLDQKSELALAKAAGKSIQKYHPTTELLHSRGRRKRRK
jgi:hypothetical protein